MTMARTIKQQAYSARLKRGRPIMLARWRAGAGEPDLVQGTFIDTTPVYWRLEVNGEFHAYPACHWRLVIL